MTPLETIETALRAAGSRKSGENSWTCPAHDDRHPSLSVSQAADGSVLLCCHAGCETADILSVLELEFRDLFATPRDRPSDPIVATYVYRNEAGAALYEVRRTASKRFIQARIDRDGRPVCGPGCMKHVRRIPYRLFELLDAVDDGKRIFICEGEKDVEALVKLGFAATTNVGGAGKWRDDYSSVLAGADVVVIQDRDDVGRRHARLVYESVRKVAECVLIMEAREGNDASDHLAAGYAIEELVEVEIEGDPPQGFESSESSETEESAWDPPVEFDGIDVPDFPTEALPRELREFVESLARSYQVPADLPACAAIATVAAAVARKVEVKVGSTHSETLSVYMAPTMGSGERKVAIREALKPLYVVEAEMQEEAAAPIQRAQELRAIGEERIKHLRREAAKAKTTADREKLTHELVKERAELVEVPAFPQLIADDVTPEELGRVLERQGERIFVASEEAGALFSQVLGKYQSGQPDIDLYLKSYDGGSARVDRVTREPIVLERPSLTMLLTPQPGVLMGFAAHPELRDRGFVARFLFALPRSLVGTRTYRDRAVDPAARAAYDSVITKLAHLKVPEDEIPAMQIEGAALTLWAKFADEIEQQQADGGRLTHVRDWASKLAGKAARIAGIFHMIEHRHDPEPWATPISTETIAAAWAVSEYFVEHALAAFELMGADANVEMAKKLLGWFRRKGKTEFSQRDAHQAHRYFGKAEALDEPLAVLVSRGFIRPVPVKSKPTGRKPSPQFQVHPLYSERSQHSEFGDPSGSETSEYSEVGARV